MKDIYQERRELYLDLLKNTNLPNKELKIESFNSNNKKEVTSIGVYGVVSSWL